jgi:broad specificity phosphatase PhoE
LTSHWCLATIRHGETDYNKQSRYAGTIDIELNEGGRNDARLASKNMRSNQFDVVITSPLKRALETAQILTDGRVEIIPSPFAQERNFGILQGLTSEDAERIRPPIHFIKIGNDYHSLDPPKAETFEELRGRADRLRDYILENFKGSKVLVVSHGVFLQQFHGSLRGQDWIEALGIRVRNLELTTFCMEGDKVVSERRVHLMDRKQNDF